MTRFKNPGNGQYDERFGSNASIEQCSRHIGFTSDTGRIPAAQRNSAMGHGTKSLRDSPLRGEPDREDVARGKDRR
jgi:hypothetical protein